jgi:hypothetical protein
MDVADRMFTIEADDVNFTAEHDDMHRPDRQHHAVPLGEIP